MKWRNVAKIEMPLPEKPSDPIEIALLAAELDNKTPEIDLHELNTRIAIDALGNFLNKEFVGVPRRDVKVVKVIHGRGSGVLQGLVADYLNKAKKFVVRFRTSSDPYEANGVTYVVLAPNKKY
ncbi:MAG: Smr/MutS family protein [Patescibacteria group bacterium]|nr:Smr/MutS family protein [Patescibacteria group bacterium]